MVTPSTLFTKLWDAHRIVRFSDGDDLIAVDRLLLHERTGGVALRSILNKGHTVFDTNRVFAIMDHIVSFLPGRGENEARSPGGDLFIRETRSLAKELDINLIDTNSREQGIVHVIAPELGIAAPSLSLVCPDSHTCSLGALGALAWGIGSSKAEHVIVTSAIRVRKPKQMLIRFTGNLNAGCSAKDIALFLIAEYGAKAGQNFAVEYSGRLIDAMSIEERLTLCNLATEFGAFTAIIAPDQKTIAYTKDKPFAPNSDCLDEYQELKTDDDVAFDKVIEVNAEKILPHVSWGTSPEDSIPIDGSVPSNASNEALKYMDIRIGQPIRSLDIQGAFIGSCTNGRLSDLQSAAKILKGRRVARGVTAVCVPGSQKVKRDAEALGIDQIFKSSGFEWGDPGCAMCFYAGGDTFPPYTRVVSSTNRNFEGRQGPKVRTHLASPAIVASSAIAGRICSPDDLKC